MSSIVSVSYPSIGIYQGSYVEVRVRIPESNSDGFLYPSAYPPLAALPEATKQSLFPTVVPAGTLVDFSSVSLSGALALFHTTAFPPDTDSTFSLGFTETLAPITTYFDPAPGASPASGVQLLGDAEAISAPVVEYETTPAVRTTDESAGEAFITIYVPIELAESVGLTIPEAPPGGDGDVPPMKVNITCQWQRFHNSYALIPSGSNVPNPTQDDVLITLL